MIPDWQLPPGVDRGLWDYLHAGDMVRDYDGHMAASPLAAADVAYCEQAFASPGRLLDLGCGTGRLCIHFARKGYDCVGVDLSEEMLAKARESHVPVDWQQANFVEPLEFADASFDYAACLFSTLGMVRGVDYRSRVLANTFRLLKPGGRFVLHVHNRHFRGLGWRRVLGRHGGDIAMSQAYGGAPLTLHHFTRRGAVQALETAGFTVKDVHAIGVDGQCARLRWHVYGWLMQGERPA